MDIELEKKEEEKRQKQFLKMTTQPVGKLLFSLSIPTIISMMVTNIYNLVDTAFVGTLGTSQSGATGIVFGYMAILQAFAFMCGQGAGSVMSRRLGAQKIEEANIYASTGFFLSFGLGVMIAIISAVTLNPLLVLLGSTATIAPFAKIYISYILIAAPFFTASLTMNNLLRYEGKAKLGTIGLMTGAVINIAGDALFMFGFRMGIAGAGFSTALSQMISFSILLSMYLRKRTQTQISIRHLSRQVHTYWDIAATGFPSLIRQALNSIATVLLNRGAGIYGDEAVAAMSIVSRISFFAIAFALGIGQGFQPISSFNYGAGKKDRVRKAFWLAIISGTILLIVIAIPVYIFSDVLVARLRDDPAVIEIGTRALQLMALTFVFVPFTMMVEMGFQSTGARLLASLGSSLRSGIVLIPALLILQKVRGLAGIQEAQPVSMILTFVICIGLCKVFMDRLK